MKLIDSIKFRIGKWAFSGLQRGYSEVASTGRQMSDWILNGLSDDADLQANWPALVQKSRDLFKLNPYMRKFRVDLIANVFGSEGITLQMKIKEQVDRVVYATPADGKDDPRQLEEKAWLEAKQRADDDLRERAEKHEIKLRKREFITSTTTGNNGSTRAKAVVKAGQPDVYANNLIERAWKRWQKRENCTVSRRYTYAQTREHRLTMCARDGDVFIRHVRGFDNEFGYAIQLIAAEWIDHALNEDLRNGRYIKMGIEYDQWGAVAAYYVIKRDSPHHDWRNNYVNGLGSHYGGVTNAGYSPQRHERVEARDMIHYCAVEDAQSGRGAPWISSVIGKLWQLDKYSEAEVISARAEACKGGHYESSMAGTDPMDLADRVEQNGQKLTNVVEPAMWKPLPYGWTAKAHDPKHPNGNFPAFKKEMLREVCAGIGDQYITFSGDLEGTSYSSGRIGSLDVRELWKMVQRFDIDTAEIPIFEAWLEMALTKGAIPLPLTKLEKFKAAQFNGRRWPWVDPMKDAKANEVLIASGITSRTRITNENGDDFEEIVEELAMEKILMEEAGLNVSNAALPEPDVPDDGDDVVPAKPAAKSRLNV